MAAAASSANRVAAALNQFEDSIETTFSPWNPQGNPGLEAELHQPDNVRQV
jgi:hypothetical protein